MLRRHLVKDRRLHGRRRDAIDTHASIGEFLAQGLGQRNHRRLAGAVGAGVRVAVFAGHRGDVDDAPGIARAHQWHHFAAAVKQAIEVDLHHLQPLLGRIVPDLDVGPGDTGAVDQCINLRPARHGLPNGIDHAGVLAHIDHDRLHFAGQWAQRLLRRGHGGSIAVPPGDLGAGSQKTLRDGQAKTGSAAGDDGMTAVEIELVHEGLRVGKKTGMDSCLRRNDGVFSVILADAGIHDFACRHLRLDRHPAVHGKNLSAGEHRLVTGQIHHNRRDLGGLGQATHGLTGNEIFACLHRVGIAVDAVLQ